MVLHGLQLSATDTNWRLFMVRKADSAFLTHKNKVLERDDYTCQFCGFRAKEHLDVVNLDGNYRNNRSSNLVAACGFCAQCFFLEAVGQSNFGGGSLIYLPQMTQGELNALCHVLFTSMISGSASAVQARNIYRGFKLQSQLVEKELGEGLSNPALYGRLLVETKGQNATALNEGVAANIRLLPDVTKFTEQVEAWSKAALNEWVQ